MKQVSSYLGKQVDRKATKIGAIGCHTSQCYQCHGTGYFFCLPSPVFIVQICRGIFQKISHSALFGTDHLESSLVKFLSCSKAVSFIFLSDRKSYQILAENHIEGVDIQQRISLTMVFTRFACFHHRMRQVLKNF